MSIRVFSYITIMNIKISTRLVIITKTKVFKIPIDRRGWLQGINEKKVWDTYGQSGLLAPLLWSFGGFVCMERVLPTSYIPPYLIQQIKDMVPTMNIKNCDLHRLENWGERNGTKVLLDYGIDQRISEMYK